MTVIVKKKRLILGQEKELTTYLPKGVFPSSPRQKGAELLDEEIRRSVEKINKDFEDLPKSTKLNEIKKWYWLGGRLNQAIKTFKNMEKTDLDNNAIWPGINQYLRSELKRGFDTKRSGTPKDHLRKCWLLYKTNSITWFRSWVGWDALVDRGEQLIRDTRVMEVLQENFTDLKDRLDKKDYQFIFKELSARIPSSKNRREVFLMTEKELDSIAKDIKVELLNKRRGIS